MKKRILSLLTSALFFMNTEAFAKLPLENLPECRGFAGCTVRYVVSAPMASTLSDPTGVALAVLPVSWAVAMFQLFSGANLNFPAAASNDISLVPFILMVPAFGSTTLIICYKHFSDFYENCAAILSYPILTLDNYLNMATNLKD